MKKLYLILALILPMLFSCSTNYYLVTLSDEANLYLNIHDTVPVNLVPAQTEMYMVVDSKTGFKKVIWKDFEGYTLNPNYRYASDIPYKKAYIKKLRKSAHSIRINSGSTSSGGRVQVKGYYRKNGTYVKPHSRSAPRRH